MHQAQAHSSTAEGRESTAEDISTNLRHFQRHLRAENLSPATVEVYTRAVRQFGDFLAARGMPRTVAEITREYIEEWLVSLQGERKGSTVNTRFRGLQAFWK